MRVSGCTPTHASGLPWFASRPTLDLALPEPTLLIQPPDDAVDVGPDTVFRVTAHANRVRVFQFAAGLEGETNVVTTANRITPGELTAIGVPLIADEPYTWNVEEVGPAGSVDDVAGPAGIKSIVDGAFEVSTATRDSAPNLDATRDRYARAEPPPLAAARPARSVEAPKAEATCLPGHGGDRREGGHASSAHERPLRVGPRAVGLRYGLASREEMIVLARGTRPQREPWCRPPGAIAAQSQLLTRRGGS
jgi:hypothetical protein